MRRQLSSKSNTCPERCVVYMADISVKVCAQYPGRSPVLRGNHPTLSPPRGGETEREKSAESIVGISTIPKARTGTNREGACISMYANATEAGGASPLTLPEEPRQYRGGYARA